MEANKTVNKKADSMTSRTATGDRGKDGKLKTVLHSKSAVKMLDSVVRISSREQRGEHNQHPAVFPLQLPMAILPVYGGRGSLCYEPFCGSGTTVIAAQKTSRVCYAMELNPKFADIAVRRWETETGQQAVRA